MIRVLVLVTLLLGSLLAAPEFRYTGLRCNTIQSSGPGARKIDLVIVGDGYSGSDLNRGGAFEKDARGMLSMLWQVSPFGDYKDRFNVHLIPVESHTSRRVQNQSPDLFAFGSTVVSRDVVRLERRSEVLTAARNAPDMDIVVTLTTLSGRATGGKLQDGRRTLPAPILTRDRFGALAHELGHSMADLGDEYDSDSKLADREDSTMPSGDFRQANLTRDGYIDPKNRETVRATAKWGHFLDLPDSYPLVSAYQGGYYRSVGVWRASFRCVMRSSQGSSFCPVCHEEMVKAILALCGESFDHDAYHKRFPLKKWK